MPHEVQKRIPRFTIVPQLSHLMTSSGKRYGGYSIDISGTKDLPLWLTEDYTAQYDGNAEPVSVHLDKGDYTITITDKNITVNSYSKAITVKEDATGKELRFATNFGAKNNEPQKKGEFEPSDVPSDAVEFNGHYYYLYDFAGLSSANQNTWENALVYCQGLNGYLATITSEEENEFLFNYMKECAYESAYFGLADSASEGIWTWCNGETVSYTNWASGEPGGRTSENYGMFYYKYSNGTWNDGDFKDTTTNNGGTAFICEWGEYTVAPGNEPEQESVRATSDERDIVLVLDVSGSMSGTPMEETKKASVNFINTVLEEYASIGIVTYDDNSYMLSDFSVNKSYLNPNLSSGTIETPPESSQSSSIFGVWDSIDGKQRMIFTSKGSFTVSYENGIQNADGSTVIIDLQKGKRNDGGFAIDGNSIVLTIDMQQRSLNYSLSGDSMSIGDLSFCRVEKALANQLVGIWENNDRKFEFDDEGNVTITRGSDYDRGVYAILSESKIMFNIEGNGASTYDYSVDGKTFSFGNQQYIKDGDNSDYNEVIAAKDILVGTWKSDATGAYYVFRADGIYEYYAVESLYRIGQATKEGLYDLVSTNTIKVYQDMSGDFYSEFTLADGVLISDSYSSSVGGNIQYTKVK